jgi:transcriptional regulator with XRE-family HTH domain
VDSQGIAARIRAKLTEKGWTARELGRRAELGDNAVASNALKRLTDGHGVSLRTLRGFAQALGVTEAWLINGDASASAETADVPAPTQLVHDAINLPPGCLAHGHNYALRKATARRLAPDVGEQWVWDDLDTVDTLFLGEREPSPAALADLARVIQKHGRPR